MRTILMRAGVSPLDVRDVDGALRQNLIGSNSGNLIYQYGACRTLMTEGTRIECRYFRDDNSPEAYLQWVNSTCDCVILPLANAFRPNFPLKGLTGFVKRLKIPCVVVGIGLQAGAPEQIAGGFSFDADAAELVRAVLDHSALLGLRGEITADYLKALGFSPERHFTVTGCPSLFTHGLNLPAPRVKPLDAHSRISFNTVLAQPRTLHDMMARAVRDFPDHHLVLQKRDELAMLRYGAPVFSAFARGNAGANYYPRTGFHPLVREGRAIGFVNARAWWKYMEGIDFSFGSRIHGNFAAILSGVPAFVFTTDTRTQELCRYHGVAHMPAAQVKPGQDIREIYERADFEGVRRGHAQRFSHFLDFLNANGLDHIYRDAPDRVEAPLDAAVAALPEWGLVRREGRVSLARRMQGGFAYAEAAACLRGKLAHVVRSGRRP